jgi:phenylalanyl-tRNA synthetase beta chain
MKVSVLWLKDFIDFTFSSEELREIFDSVGLPVIREEKINGDSVFELELFPHRFDTLGHLGVARELAAAKNLPWKEHLYSVDSSESGSSDLEIQIRNESLCPRCCGMIVYDLKDQPSPDWMQERLQAVGISPVDRIRDAAVYTLLSTGQPVHLFRLEELKGKCLIIRNARPKETLVTGDGIEIELDKDMLVIADEEKCLSLAGLTDDPVQASFRNTQAVVVVSAFFDPSVILRAGNATGIQTESSHRYERGVDIDALPRTVKQVCSLLTHISGESACPVTDVYPRPRKPKTLIIRQRKINEVLGTNVEETFFLLVLQRAGFEVIPHQKESWRVNVPAFRSDIENETDLIEEIGRHYGYDRIPPRLPQLDTSHPCREKKNKVEDNIRQALFHQGFDEAVNDSFMAPGIQELFAEEREPVPVINPISSRTSFLKNTLLAGLLENMQMNFARGIRRIHLFEIGHCFNRKDEEIHEKPMLAFVSCGNLDPVHWQKKSQQSDIFHVKGTCELILKCAGAHPVDFDEEDFPVYEPGNALAVKVKGEKIGHLGTIKSSIRKAIGLKKEVNAGEIDLKTFLAVPQFSGILNPVDLNPGIIRRISFTGTQAARYKDVKEVIEGLSLPGFKSMDVYDRHVDTSSDGEIIHISLQLVFNHPDRDISESKVNEYMEKIIHVCQNKFSFHLRQGG